MAHYRLELPEHFRIEEFIPWQNRQIEIGDAFQNNLAFIIRIARQR